MSSDFIKRIPSEPGRWRAIILALVMHLILLLILWFSVSWQNQKPVAVEAEIWSPQSTVAAPPPPPPPITPPEPAPEPVKTPEPIKKIEPVKPVNTAPTDNVKKTADIALEKEKKRKEQQELKDKAEALKKEKLAKEKEKKESDKIAELLRKKQAEEAKKVEEAERKKQVEEEKRKLAEEQRQKQEEAAAAQRAKARHEEDMKRMASEASGAGNAEKASTGKPDAAYARKIANRIRSNTILSLNDISGNPTVEFRIDLRPDGSVKDIQLLKKSGSDAFDKAVKRAIETVGIEGFDADPSTGRVPSSIVISHRPKD
jgi:colicin import membrane protein